MSDPKNPLILLKADQLIEHANRGPREEQQVALELLRRARIKQASMKARAADAG